MLIIDGHLDLAWNILMGNRDLNLPLPQQRSREDPALGRGMGMGTVAFPEMRVGRVAICFATLLARCTGNPVAQLDYPTPVGAYASAHGQLAAYLALQRNGKVRLLGDTFTLDAHITEWEKWEFMPGSDPPALGFILAMESADAILEPEDLPDWYAHGVRIIGPAHYGDGRYAGGTGSESGLTCSGVRLLAEMEKVHIILDVTHCSDTAFWQALEHFSGILLASHNNCRALVNHPRQFSDEQIKAIIQRNGVIGTAMDDWMLVPNWVRGQSSKNGITLEHVARHIDHICQLAGNSRHAAIGSDLDGLYGKEQTPEDVDTIANLQDLIPILLRLGYSLSNVADIFHANWLRLLYAAWK
jgi:membrane dipeptidase